MQSCREETLVLKPCKVQEAQFGSQDVIHRRLSPKCREGLFWVQNGSS